jgi:hypothetical protein
MWEALFAFVIAASLLLIGAAVAMEKTQDQS